MLKVSVVEVVHEFEDTLAFCKVVYLEQLAVRQNFGHQYRQRTCHAHVTATGHALVGLVVFALPYIQNRAVHKCLRRLSRLLRPLKQELELRTPG